MNDELKQLSMVLSSGTTVPTVTLGVYKHPDYPYAQLPTQQHEGDIGFDLYACEDSKVPLNRSAIIETGLILDIPRGYGVLMSGRSSSFAKRGILVHEGWIDQQYGETIKVLAYGLQGSLENYYFDRGIGYYQLVKAGERIAQLRVVRTLPTQITELDNRPDKHRQGIGSTGV
jgi:dUTP pyrophosphatase